MAARTVIGFGVALVLGTAMAQQPGGDGPSGPAAGGPGAKPPAQFFEPPGQPANRKILSPIMSGGPPGPKAASTAPAPTPPADPRNFEGAYTKVVGYNAYTPVDRKDYWEAPPFTPEAERIFWHRVEMENAGTPVPDAGIKCEPMGLTRGVSAEFGWRILQSADRLTWMINEDHLVRRIRIDGKHPKNLKASYMGDSVAHWDGDTLVIDSIGFNDRTWLDFDGEPHSARMHVTERLRKINNGTQLEDMMTIDDPVMYTRPWTARLIYGWAPISEIAPEIICEENDVQLADYTGKDLQKHQ